MIDNKDNGQAEEDIILSAEAEEKNEFADDEEEIVTLSSEPVKRSGKQKKFFGMQIGRAHV